MSRQGLAVAAAASVVLFAQGARADVAEGTIKSINQVSNTFNIEDEVYQWSSLNTVGPDLHDLNAGDEVKIGYQPTGSGKNVVQRVTLVKSAAAAPYSAAYRPVSDERLVKPEPQNWLQLGQLSGLDVASSIRSTCPTSRTWRWSGLLDRRRFVHAGAAAGQRRRDVRRDPYDKVIALDATSGDLLWEYQRELPEGFGALHNTKRGVALYGDKVYLTGQDAVLVTLDAATGEVAWESPPVADWQEGCYMTMAPLVVNGKVMVGVSGSEFGVRGFIAAYDAERPAGVEDLHHRAGRARPRHLGGRHLAARRRLGLDDQDLRSRPT